ncbi:MAG: hypothetical protein LiPW39_499 [Parcubacteria group bacterium LiPW_39]|nr:MAG: hypothetical protein LiPW39_499 [Parcubacteria group bacterium LiPW_39]
MNKIIIGLAGEIGCGKGVIAKYIIEKYNGSSFRFSTMLRDVLRRIYLPDSRENMQILSTLLRQNFGEDVLARVISEDFASSDKSIVMVDGIRRLADIKYLKELPEFKLVYIETDIHKRYERILKRNENPDDSRKTFEEFQKEREQEADRQIKDLKKYADFIIENNGTYEQLYARVDKIIKEADLK